MPHTVEEPADLEPLEGTLELIYEHCKGGPARQQTSADAIDAKAFQLFAAATVLIGLGAFSSTDLNWLAATFYGLAAAAYAFGAHSMWRIARARSLRVVDGADRWWPSYAQTDTDYLRDHLLRDLAESFRENRRTLDEKGAPLNRLVAATTVEAVLLVAAVISALA